MVRYVLSGLGLSFVALAVLGPEADSWHLLGALFLGGFTLALVRGLFGRSA